MKTVSSWTKYNVKAHGAETPFQVRENATAKPVLAVVNQHGQLLEAEGRKLIAWTPDEMEAPAEEKAADAPAPAAKK